MSSGSPVPDLQRIGRLLRRAGIHFFKQQFVRFVFSQETTLFSEPVVALFQPDQFRTLIPAHLYTFFSQVSKLFFCTAHFISSLHFFPVKPVPEKITILPDEYKQVDFNNLKYDIISVV